MDLRGITVITITMQLAWFVLEKMFTVTSRERERERASVVSNTVGRDPKSVKAQWSALRISKLKRDELPTYVDLLEKRCVMFSVTTTVDVMLVT